MKLSWGTDLAENDRRDEENFMLAVAGNDQALDLVRSYRDGLKRRCLLLPLTLGDLHARRPPDLVGFGELVAQLSIGLEHMHRNSVVHLDLKPHNVLVFLGHVYKISDLGCAMRDVDSLENSKYICTRLTGSQSCSLEEPAWPGAVCSFGHWGLFSGTSSLGKKAFRSRGRRPPWSRPCLP